MSATISVLSGAIKNAGDFLIVERSKALLKTVYPESDIIEYDRSKNLDQYIEVLNKSSVIVFAGGPAYLTNIYPDVIPFVSNINEIETKMFALGMGWKAMDDSSVSMNNYSFNRSTRELLNKIEQKGMMLGCRDYETVDVLRMNGYDNTMMTGCPAWYSDDVINGIDSEKEYNIYKTKRLMISDPKSPGHFNLCKQLISEMRKKYPLSEITLVFHRNFSQNLASYAKQEGVIIANIQSSGHKVSIYDKCDLHVGFRVHAHIYNLSKNNPSILIEEDSRGAGVNNALGMRSIKAYDNKINLNNKYLMGLSRRVMNNLNIDLLRQVNDYLLELENTKCFRVRRAQSTIKYYYQQMIKHIASIENG